MAYHTIKIKKYSDCVKERTPAANITPGMLIELTSSGTMQAHSTAGGDAQKVWALENELEGEDINTAVGTSDKVQCWYTTAGDEIYAILNDGEDIDIGDFLESAGNGNLQEHVTDIESFESNEPGAISVYPEQIVAVALEHLDIQSSSAEESSGPLGYDKRIVVESL